MTTPHAHRRGFTRNAALALAALMAASAITGCSVAAQSSKGGSEASGSAPTTLKIATHDSFKIPPELIKEFEKETGYTLVTSSPGDTGTLVNTLILSKDNPSVDGFFGIDTFTAGTLLKSGAVDTSITKILPGAEKYAAGDGLSPIDLGDVCINVDDAWFAKKGLTPPSTFEDLTKPDYKNLLVVTNPASSSPGLAFLAATHEKFGDGAIDYWKKLWANGTKVVEGWSDAYYGDFSGADGKGAYPLVLSYASSPSAGVGPNGEAPTTSVMLNTCIAQVEYAGVTKGAANPEGAKKFIDFLLSAKVQAALPENMYVYPVDSSVALPATWARYAPHPEHSMVMDVSTAAAHRTDWIKEWTAAFHEAVR